MAMMSRRWVELFSARGKKIVISPQMRIWEISILNCRKQKLRLLQSQISWISQLNKFKIFWKKILKLDKFFFV